MMAHFADGIEIPLHPFFGSIGVAPPDVSGRISSAPPWIHAGNLDNKDDDAYMLSSVAADLDITQLVDGNKACMR